jgi:hypothetical protein
LVDWAFSQEPKILEPDLTDNCHILSTIWATGNTGAKDALDWTFPTNATRINIFRLLARRWHQKGLNISAVAFSFAGPPIANWLLG